MCRRYHQILMQFHTRVEYSQVTFNGKVYSVHKNFLNCLMYVLVCSVCGYVALNKRYLIIILFSSAHSFDSPFFATSESSHPLAAASASFTIVLIMATVSAG